eukprot:2020714-Rhodomonas_salina.1
MSPAERTPNLTIAAAAPPSSTPMACSTCVTACRSRDPSARGACARNTKVKTRTNPQTGTKQVQVAGFKLGMHMLAHRRHAQHRTGAGQRGHGEAEGGEGACERGQAGERGASTCALGWGCDADAAPMPVAALAPRCH